MPLILGIPILYYILGIGTISIATYTWYLTTPTGALTWKNIITFLDNNIRKVIDWSFGIIKAELFNLVVDTANLLQSIKVFIIYIQSLPSKLTNLSSTISSTIVTTYINPMKLAITTLTQTITQTITPKITALETWRKSVANWLHVEIEKPLLELITWRKSVANWLHVEIEAPLKKAITDIVKLTQMITIASLNLDKLKTYITTEINKITSIVIPDAVRSIYIDINAIKDLISTTFQPMFNFFKDGKHWLERLIEMIKQEWDDIADAVLNSDIEDAILGAGWLPAKITQIYTPILPKLIVSQTKTFGLKFNKDDTL